MLTPEGEKPIEALRPGDLVLSRDESDVAGPVEPKAVEVSPAEAFAAFVDRFGEWWPREFTWAKESLAEIGIEAPLSFNVHTQDDIAVALERISYPCALKPVHSHAFARHFALCCLAAAESEVKLGQIDQECGIGARLARGFVEQRHPGFAKDVEEKRQHVIAALNPRH